LLPRLVDVNPTQQVPKGDHGAETLRNYSYQSTYAVILLCGAAAKKNEYRAVWCEQEDDLLAEISDDLFDSYQVKTKDSELGYWDIKDDGFVKAIQVFLHLQRTFPGSIRYYNFISNTGLLESDAKGRAHLCPGRLATAARSVSSHTSLAEEPKKGFTELVRLTESVENDLFAVLQRFCVPSEPLRRESCIAELVTNHLPQIECCGTATTAKLRRAAVQLIDLFDEASRLSSQSPDRHYACLNPMGKNNPQLLNKRVSLEEFLCRCKETIQPGFRYVPEIGKSHLAQTNPDIKRFYKKLKQGTLGDYADTLRERATSANAVLLDLATRPPDGAGDVHHLKALVKGECDDAHAKTINDSVPFGLEMYREVLGRFEELAKTNPEITLRQPKEVLMGIAATLTEECKVWWSKPFDVTKD
jgi:hypothetical protein